MINGVIVGIVIDNVDPKGMHRILVEYPVPHSDRPHSSWCRIMTPMAGKQRGLVMLPDIGTEVVLANAYRSMSPYVLGAVYNDAEDLAGGPYQNDDDNDDKRVFWSRNDHMVIFDDTSGAEMVEFGAQAGSRLDVTSAPIYDSLDAANKMIKEYCAGDTTWNITKTISIKCMNFKLEASNSIKITAGTITAVESTAPQMIQGQMQQWLAPMIEINPSAPPPPPKPVLPTPSHSHSPT